MDTTHMLRKCFFFHANDWVMS